MGLWRRHAGLVISLGFLVTSARGEARLFMTEPGAHGSVAASGAHTVYVSAGGTLTLEVWIDDTTPQLLGGYQVALPGAASSVVGTGTVTYVDTAGPGGSVRIDTTRPDWVFAGQGSASVYLSETGLPAGFAMLGLLPIGQGVLVTNLAYLGEFQFAASADASGVFLLEFLPNLAPPNGGTVLTDDTGLGEVPAQFQSLLIKIGAPPVNDACEGKTELFAGDTPFDTTLASTTVPNAGFGGPGNAVCDDGGDDTIEADLWFNYTAVCGGPVTVHTCSQAGFDTRIEVYEGCGVCPPSNLVACNDDAGGCAGGTSSVSFTAADGACYTIRVGGASEFAIGSGTLTLIADASRCAIDGSCYDPGALNPGNDCEACDPSASVDSWTPRSAGSACGDQNDTTCDHADTCDGSGSCQGNFEPADTACGNTSDSDCDHPDTCDGAGNCQDNFEPADTACGDTSDSDCDHPDTCDGSGTCQVNFAPNGGPCSDGLNCIEGESCTDGACGGGTPVDCSDGVPCTTEFCDEVAGCQNVLEPGFCLIDGACESEGTLNPLNECETCDPAASTGSWSPVAAGVSCGDPSDTDCDHPDQCDGAGGCSPNHEADGTSCANGVFCDGAETCQQGSCEPGAAPCIDAAHCDEAAGVCRECLAAVECGDASPADGIVDDACLWYGCESDACATTPRRFGDVGGPFGACPLDGFTNIHDRNHVLSCFSMVSTCEDINMDIGGPFGDCNPDGFCNIHDANHTLSAFEGLSACSCPLDGGGPSPVQGTRVVATANLIAVPEFAAIRAGDEIAVRVFVREALKDLRSYQLEVVARGGQRGRLELIDVWIDTRPDYVFAGAGGGFSAFNVLTGQMLSGLESAGVETVDNGYLATFTYRASADAAGTFTVGVLAEGQTYLIASRDGKVDVASTRAARVVVSDRGGYGSTRR